MYNKQSKVELPGEIKFRLISGGDYSCKAAVYTSHLKKKQFSEYILSQSKNIKKVIKTILTKLSKYRISLRKYRQRVFKHYKLTQRLNLLIRKVKVKGIKIFNLKRIYKKSTIYRKSREQKIIKNKEKQNDNSGGLGG